MNASLKLLRIEARRNVGLWLFPFVVLLIGYTTAETLPTGIWLWPQTSLSIRDTLVLVGPLAAGLAAWAAGRNRRRDLEELLATTSQPAAIRDLANWGATTAWVCLGYVVAAALMLLATYFGSEWGAPILWPVLIGFFAIVANSALGYAAGYYLPTRITSPVVAVALYWVQGIAAYYLVANPASYLSPVTELNYSVFWGVLPHIFIQQSLWLLGISGVALAAVVLKGGGSPKAAWISLFGASTVAAIGAAALLVTPVEVTAAQKQEAHVPYEPICAKGAIPVCVHPAYEKMLPETAAVVDEVTEPLISVPGGPTRAEQKSYGEVNLRRDGTLIFYLSDTNFGTSDLAAELVRALVRDPVSTIGADKELFPNDAQAVIAAWLLQQAGRDPHSLDYWTSADANSEAVAATRKRFDQLSPEERRSWFRKNYVDLRAGKIGLKDLP